MRRVDTDYLVIGAGAAGMAFTDSLITEADVDVTMVDRRDRPGGHWNDAYPFVRLHQPAAFYGVNSRSLATDSVDATGPNAGMYEQSSAPEIVDYFESVMRESLVPSGRVRFCGMSDYVGERDGVHRFVSLLTGEETAVTVRRRLVNAAYQEAEIPSTHELNYGVAPDARVVPVNDLVTLSQAPAGYVLIGSGKTAMDAAAWLLRHDVLPADITWIRPRDAWLLNRAFTQPLDQVSSIIDAVSLDLEASANAQSIDDVFRFLEESGRLLRLDPAVWPTMYRCATVSAAELEELRAITNVVRLGRVLKIGTDTIQLEQGSIPTSPDHIHVDCTAGGLRTSAARPIFEPGLITLQQIRTCQPTFNAAFIAYVETSRDTDEDKNALCPPNQYPDTAVDMLRGILVQQLATNLWTSAPDVNSWMARSRLNAARAMGDHMKEPRMQQAVARLIAANEPAMANLKRLLTDA